MRHYFRTLAVLLVAAPLFAGTAAAQEKSLYLRLGGYDAIAAVSDDFIGRLVADPEFSRFFEGFSLDSKMRLRQSLVDFVCKATGGPCYYFGRDMKTVHAGVGITKAEWDKATVHFGETMQALGVAEPEQKDLAALILPLEKDIVEKP